MSIQVQTARDVPVGFTGTYCHLPTEFIGPWASNQTQLSKDYREGKIPGASANHDTRVRKTTMLNHIFATLTKRSNLSHEEILLRLDEASARLEDPGLLTNFEFFDVPSSDFMLQFYFAVWDGRIAEAMCYLLNHGKDLQGVSRQADPTDIWYIMTQHEGMCIDRAKLHAMNVKFMKDYGVKRATSFGGGNIPERFFGLPDDVKLTVFDNGLVSPLEELFPNPSRRLDVDYYHELLSKAPTRPSLISSQDLVLASGVLMYMSTAEMVGTVQCATALLRPDGHFIFDYLVKSKSMERVVSTQGWPQTVVVFDNVNDAIEQGCTVLSKVNDALGGKAYMEATDIRVTCVDPWGPTSVSFIVKKITE